MSNRFLKSGSGIASAEAAPEAPILKMFERADWTLFRTVEGLQAGIQQLFADEPEAEWRAHIETTANELSHTAEDEDRPGAESESDD